MNMWDKFEHKTILALFALLSTIDAEFLVVSFICKRIEGTVVS